MYSCSLDDTYFFTSICCHNSKSFLVRSNDNQAILVQSVEGKNGSDSISATADETMTNFAIYSGLIMGLMVVAILRAFLFFHIAVTAAERAHNTMFHSIIRSTVAFFDVNPVGNVLRA